MELSQLAVLAAAEAVRTGLIEKEDETYFVNRLLETVGEDAPLEAAPDGRGLLDLTAEMAEKAAQKGLIADTVENRDRFICKLFGILTPPPAAVRRQFFDIKGREGTQKATDWFYALCRNNDYIRTRQVARNVLFDEDSPAGRLTVTINLSKPEKDPRDIAAALQKKSADYPKCMLCRENPGYAGRQGYPARQNHRVIPLSLHGETWYFQYSPYLYYNEHCIIFHAEHVPMHLTRASFERMLDFVDQFPHYLIGANADLPIVGGSILTHDHYQGGKHVFPMERAQVRFSTMLPGNIVTLSVMDWPITCLKMQSSDRAQIAYWADTLLNKWRGYSDPARMIYAETDGTPHNTLTPVLRKNGDTYTFYLMLRNNLTTKEHPMGLYHPHADKHAIKKENIGLIEAMGLFILPGRLKKEMEEVKDYLLGGTLPEASPHKAFAETIKQQHPVIETADMAERLIRKAMGLTCYRVLCDCGVYKRSDDGMEGLMQFLTALGARKE